MRPALLAVALVCCAGLNSRAQQLASLIVYTDEPLIALIVEAVGSETVTVTSDSNSRAHLRLSYASEDPDSSDPSVVYLSDGLPLKDVESPELIPIDPRWFGYLLVGVSEILAEHRPDTADQFFQAAAEESKHLRMGIYQIRRSIKHVPRSVRLNPETDPRVLSVLESLGHHWEFATDGRTLLLSETASWAALLSPWQETADALLKLHSGEPDRQ